MPKEIIKTWPSSFSLRKVRQIFSHEWAEFYFTLGRGKPKEEISKLWYTFRGRILCSFVVGRVVMNAGQLPRLSRLDGHESEWQIKQGHWVAICPGPCVWFKDRVYFAGFRGWRYFDLDSHRQTPESRMRV